MDIFLIIDDYHAHYGIGVCMALFFFWSHTTSHQIFIFIFNVFHVKVVFDAKHVYLSLDFAVISRKMTLLIITELCNLLVIVTLLLAMPSVMHIISLSLNVSFLFCFPSQTIPSVFTLNLN